MSRWSCGRMWHDALCGSQKSQVNEKGVMECRRCWAVLAPGEGNAGDGAGVAPHTEKQRAAFDDHEGICWP